MASPSSRYRPELDEDLSDRRKTTPLGIKLLVGLGVLSVLLSVFFGAHLFTTGEGAVRALAVISIAMSVLEAVILWGLWSLKAWAWSAARAFYGIRILMNLLPLNILGVLFYTGVVVYVFTKKRHFTEV